MEKSLSLQKNILWNTIGNIIYLICQYLTTVLVVRLLTANDTGIFSIAINLTNLFVAFAGYGMRNFQISDKDKEFSDGTYMYSRIITSLFSLLLLFIFLIANTYTFYTKVVVIAYMVFKFSELFFDIYSAYYQVQWRMDLSGKSMIIRSVVMMLSFTISLVVTKSLLFSILSLTFFSFLALYFFDQKNIEKLSLLPLRTDKESLLKLLKICFPLAVYSLLLSAISTIPKHILEQSTSPEMFGVYATIANPTVFIQAFAIPFLTPFLTLFTDYFHKKENKKFWSLFLKSVLALTILAIAASVFCVFFGELFLALLFNPEIAEHAYLLAPLVICATLNTLAWLLSGILTILRKNKTLLVINMVATLLCYFASKLLIPTFGMVGTSFVYGGTLIFINIMLFVFLVIEMNKNSKAMVV